MAKYIPEFSATETVDNKVDGWIKDQQKLRDKTEDYHPDWETSQICAPEYNTIHYTWNKQNKKKARNFQHSKEKFLKEKLSKNLYLNVPNVRQNSVRENLD